MATFIFTFECCIELYTDVVQTFTVRHLHSSRICMLRRNQRSEENLVTV